MTTNTTPTNKAVVSLTTGLEDPEKVTVAFLVSVGAAEQGRDTMMFLTKEAVRLATDGVATGVACEGCPPLPTLLERYTAAGGRYLVCPICFGSRDLDKGDLIGRAELGGTVPLWEWIGDDNAVTFSY
jgi:predicted peroxiredoxin